MDMIHFLLGPPGVDNGRPGRLVLADRLRHSYLVFLNTTLRTISLFRIDYKGLPAFYLTLPPLGTATVDTFAHCPWLFRDRATGEHMHVAHSRLFVPVPFQHRNPETMEPYRTTVPIHLPVRSLREICLWNIMQTFLSKESENDDCTDDITDDITEYNDGGDNHDNGGDDDMHENGGDGDNINNDQPRPDEDTEFTNQLNYVKLTRVIHSLDIPVTLRMDLLNILRFHTQHLCSMKLAAAIARLRRP